MVVDGDDTIVLTCVGGSFFCSPLVSVYSCFLFLLFIYLFIQLTIFFVDTNSLLLSVSVS